MSYNGYSAIARVYDKINEGINYSSWADFFEACFEKYCGVKPEIILDLACGTGRMTLEMSRRGYDMIGVDGSIDMLSEAYSANDGRVLYLCQDMRELELYGTVGATLCCLDSLNYLIGDGELERVFSLVHNYSDPDALFLFDMNSPYKFEEIYKDNSYIFEGENDNGEAFFCGWQNFYDSESKICSFYLFLRRMKTESISARMRSNAKDAIRSKRSKARLRKQALSFSELFPILIFPR